MILKIALVATRRFSWRYRKNQSVTVSSLSLSRARGARSCRNRKFRLATGDASFRFDALARVVRLPRESVSENVFVRARTPFTFSVSLYYGPCSSIHIRIRDAIAFTKFPFSFLAIRKKKYKIICLFLSKLYS